LLRTFVGFSAWLLVFSLWGGEAGLLFISGYAVGALTYILVD